MAQIINPIEPKIIITFKQGIQGGHIETYWENIPNPWLFVKMLHAALGVKIDEVEGQMQQALMKQLEEQGHPALNQ